MSGVGTTSAGSAELNTREFTEFLQAACSVLNNIINMFGTPKNLKSLEPLAETKLSQSLEQLLQSPIIPKLQDTLQVSENFTLWLTPYKNTNQDYFSLNPESQEYARTLILNFYQTLQNLNTNLYEIQAHLFKFTGLLYAAMDKTAVLTPLSGHAGSPLHDRSLAPNQISDRPSPRRKSSALFPQRSLIECLDILKSTIQPIKLLFVEHLFETPALPDYHPSQDLRKIKYAEFYIRLGSYFDGNYRYLYQAYPDFFLEPQDLIHGLIILRSWDLLHTMLLKNANPESTFFNFDHWNQILNAPLFEDETPSRFSLLARLLVIHPALQDWSRQEMSNPKLLDKKDLERKELLRQLFMIQNFYLKLKNQEKSGHTLLPSLIPNIQGLKKITHSTTFQLREDLLSAGEDLSLQIDLCLAALDTIKKSERTLEETQGEIYSRVAFLSKLFDCLKDTQEPQTLVTASPLQTNISETEAEANPNPEATQKMTQENIRLKSHIPWAQIMFRSTHNLLKLEQEASENIETRALQAKAALESFRENKETLLFLKPNALITSTQPLSDSQFFQVHAFLIRQWARFNPNDYASDFSRRNAILDLGDALTDTFQDLNFDQITALGRHLGLQVLRTQEATIAQGLLEQIFDALHDQANIYHELPLQKVLLQKVLLQLTIQAGEFSADLAEKLSKNINIYIQKKVAFGYMTFNKMAILLGLPQPVSQEMLSQIFLSKTLMGSPLLGSKQSSKTGMNLRFSTPASRRQTSIADLEQAISDFSINRFSLDPFFSPSDSPASSVDPLENFKKLETLILSYALPLKKFLEDAKCSSDLSPIFQTVFHGEELSFYTQDLYLHLDFQDFFDSLKIPASLLSLGAAYQNTEHTEHTEHTDHTDHTDLSDSPNPVSQKLLNLLVFLIKNHLINFNQFMRQSAELIDRFPKVSLQSLHYGLALLELATSPEEILLYLKDQVRSENFDLLFLIFKIKPQWIFHTPLFINHLEHLVLETLNTQINTQKFTQKLASLLLLNQILNISIRPSKNLRLAHYANLISVLSEGLSNPAHPSAWFLCLQDMLPEISKRRRHKNYFKLKDAIESSPTSIEALTEIINHLENPSFNFKINNRRYQEIIQFFARCLNISPEKPFQETLQELFPTPPSTQILLGIFKALLKNLIFNLPKDLQARLEIHTPRQLIKASEPFETSSTPRSNTFLLTKEQKSHFIKLQDALKKEQRLYQTPEGLISLWLIQANLRFSSLLSLVSLPSTKILAIQSEIEKIEIEKIVSLIQAHSKFHFAHAAIIPKEVLFRDDGDEIPISPVNPRLLALLYRLHQEHPLDLGASNPYIIYALLISQLLILEPKLRGNAASVTDLLDLLQAYKPKNYLDLAHEDTVSFRTELECIKTRAALSAENQLDLQESLITLLQATAAQARTGELRHRWLAKLFYRLLENQDPLLSPEKDLARQYPIELIQIFLDALLDLNPNTTHLEKQTQAQLFSQAPADHQDPLIYCSPKKILQKIKLIFCDFAIELRSSELSLAFLSNLSQVFWHLHGQTKNFTQALATPDIQTFWQDLRAHLFFKDMPIENLSPKNKFDLLVSHILWLSLFHKKQNLLKFLFQLIKQTLPDLNQGEQFFSHILRSSHPLKFDQAQISKLVALGEQWALAINQSALPVSSTAPEPETTGAGAASFAPPAVSKPTSPPPSPFRPPETDTPKDIPDWAFLQALHAAALAEQASDEEDNADGAEESKDGRSSPSSLTPKTVAAIAFTLAHQSETHRHNGHAKSHESHGGAGAGDSNGNGHHWG